MADKLDGLSMDIESVNRDKLQVVFPECFSEGKLDIDKLLSLCGEYITDDFEKYEFKWKGKSECLRLAQRLIYIDPPYNTGNDFVYEDDFSDPMRRYVEVTQQTTKSNPETMGRYHTNWLNMMYPRLRLAANLLRDDGVIFISIDDGEQSNMRKLCDEVFGEENFVAQMIWRSRQNKDNRNISMYKSLQTTEEHFSALYDNVPCRYFIYNSAKLSDVRQFATGANIEIMIINIDAFRKIENVINQQQDKLNGNTAISYIQATNPIVIIDEPQSVDNTKKAKDAIASLNPLCIFRYSATHREKVNLLYRLTPIDAYQMGLVKQICVSSNQAAGGFNKPYISLPNILAIIGEQTLTKRSTVYEILKQSTRLGDFLNNPQMFIENITQIILDVRRALAVDGISYKKLYGEEYYVQEIFDSGELIATLRLMV